MEKAPKGHQIVTTKDGSPSLYNETFGENLHSMEGAESETYYNFIEGCELSSHQGKNLSVLEVGFGIGTGFFCTLKYLRENFPEKKLLFYSLEIDPELVKWVLRDFPFSQEDDGISLKGPDFFLKIILGDARFTLKNLNLGPFDAIYQDPFSPKKNPTLWTTEWFSLLKSLAGPNCILSTYSASTSIRLSLLEAGWEVFNRKGFSVKRSSTVAKIGGQTPPDLKSKLLSSVIAPLRDI